MVRFLSFFILFPFILFPLPLSFILFPFNPGRIHVNAPPIDSGTADSSDSRRLPVKLSRGVIQGREGKGREGEGKGKGRVSGRIVIRQIHADYQ